MRGIRGREFDSDFRSGMAAGAILVLIAGWVLLLLRHVYRWATTRAVIPDIVAVANRPMFSIADVAFVIGLAVVMLAIASVLTRFDRRR